MVGGVRRRVRFEELGLSYSVEKVADPTYWYLEKLFVWNGDNSIDQKRKKKAITLCHLPTSFKEYWLMQRDGINSGELQKKMDVLVMTIGWSIWKDRNTRIFQGKIRSCLTPISDILRLPMFWLAGLTSSRKRRFGGARVWIRDPNAIGQGQGDAQQQGAGGGQGQVIASSSMGQRNAVVAPIDNFQYFRSLKIGMVDH